MSHKIIAVIGVPGTGKTTLMRKFMSSFSSDWKEAKFADLVYGHESGNLALIGKYEDGEIYAGTDRLSMAVMPEVKKFLEQNDKYDVIFEGDRLTSMNFLEYCSSLKNYQLHVLVLQTDEEILKSRYKERGSNQNQQFLNGRKTKISNILSNMMLDEYVEVFSNSNLDEQNIVLNRLTQLT